MNKVWGLIIIIILFFNANCLHATKKYNLGLCQIEGTVSYKDDLLEGAIIEVYSEGSINNNNILNEPSIKIKAEKDGKFHAVLKPGTYYFMAKKTKNVNSAELSPEGIIMSSRGSALGGPLNPSLQEGDLFCYYGGNPVNIAGSIKDLSLKCVKTYLLKEKFEPDSDRAELTAKILDTDGRPLQDAYAYLFSAENMDLKRMAEIVSPPSSKEGDISLSVDKPGRYFLVIRKRKEIQERGPLKIGDFYGYYYDNPLEIKNKTKISLILECLEKKKELDNSEMVIVPSGKFAFKGRIIDKNGDPVEGVFAFAYKDEFKTGKKPDYKSMITGKNGDYIIIIEQEGSYVLGARKTHGGPPEPGDIFGFYNGTEKYKIEINKGTVDNIDILVDEVK